MKLPISLLAVSVALTVSPAYAQMTLLANISANQPGGSSAGEIVAFDRNTDRMFVTSSGGGVHRVNIFDLSNPSAPAAIGNVDFSTTFGAASNLLSLTSVAVDPQGRFGVAALVPTDNTGTLGRVGFFNLSTGAVIGTANVGFHPDSVTFSADGSNLVVVNEGEFKAGGTNAPGSISVFDTSGINSGNLGTLPSLSATTSDFSAGNLAPGVSIVGLRDPSIAAVGESGTFIGTVPNFNTPGLTQAAGLEPEFASISGNKVYVSLQEANAIAEYDLSTGQWTAVDQLQKITQTIDATDQGTPLININKSVTGLPMPDTLGSYTVGGKTYVVTANEGDARPDDRDISRFGDIAGADSMNPILDTNGPSNFPLTQTGERAADQLGRLNISRLDGDTDSDGKIDQPTMLGTRSFSIWEKTAGGMVLAYDSGSFFEEYLRDNDPTGFADGRSDDKGPEPEGLTLGVIDGRTYAFVGMERTNGIFMFDVTDPLSPFLVDYNRIVDGSNSPLRPESLVFVSALDSPNGENLLLVGFEGDGSLASSERIGIFQVSAVPEPSTWAMLGICMLAAGWRLRKRSQKPCVTV